MKFKLCLKPLFIMGLLLVAGMVEATTEHYRLMWQDDPSTTMSIGWNQASGGNAVVHYGTVDKGTNASAYPNTKTPDRIKDVGGFKNTFARLTGLKPNTAYYFVIKDNMGTSERFWFKTAPDVNTERLSFIAGGDSRNNRVPRVNANKLVAKLRPHAVLFGGDMTDRGTIHQVRDWLDDWQHTIGADGRMIPIVMTRGNHEASNNFVYNFFDVPSESIYYALTFGGDLMRVYTLNTEMSIAGSQTNWLANDLTASSDVIWRTAQYHRGMRPHVATKSEGTNQYNHWAPLFEKHRVQLVMECDAHTVKTTWPIVPSSGTNGDEGFVRDDCNGTVYAGEGCWGAPLRANNDTKSWTRNSGVFNQFKWIFVDKEKIELRTIAVDNADAVGKVSDSDIFTPPANLDIWNPGNGSIVTIQGAGSLCDDGDVCTTDDVLDTNCNCAGTVQTDCSPCQQSDSLALVAIHEALNGDDWHSWRQWDLNQPMKTWHGITLNENGCVDIININRVGMSGTLVPEIGDLSEIRRIRLPNNNISGPIPDEIGNLTNLEYLYLRGNELTGSIPSTIGDLTNVKYLDISSNQLTGNIPATIGDLANLEDLHLSRNQLTGSVPNTIGNMSSLKNLQVNSNQLTDIPTTIGDLTNLIYLGLSSNQLTGIPTTINNLGQLSRFYMDKNQLTALPFMGDLDELNFLHVNDNQIAGNMPEWLADMDKLLYLRIQNNQFSGCYEPSLSSICSASSYMINRYISDGNNFDADWEDFCNTGTGGCSNKIDESTTINMSSYPNPFTQHTTITYTLPADGVVTLTIQNASGKEIAVLEENETKIAGVHTAVFEANLYPAGMYYYTIQAGEYVGTQKMILIK